MEGIPVNVESQYYTISESRLRFKERNNMIWELSILGCTVLHTFKYNLRSSVVANTMLYFAYDNELDIS